VSRSDKIKGQIFAKNIYLISQKQAGNQNYNGSRPAILFIFLFMPVVQNSFYLCYQLFLFWNV